MLPVLHHSQQCMPQCQHCIITYIIADNCRVYYSRSGCVGTYKNCEIKKEVLGAYACINKQWGLGGP